MSGSRTADRGGLTRPEPPAEAEAQAVEPPTEAEARAAEPLAEAGGVVLATSGVRFGPWWAEVPVEDDCRIPGVLDRGGRVPLYVQVADLLRDRIERGELKAGEPVPSEAALQKDYPIAQTTARRVARELRARGLVFTVSGEGTFVGRPGTPRAFVHMPIYRRIAADIVERIERGDIAPNRTIPGERVLMRRYGVAKVTVRQAVAYLREHGWVVTVPYRGSYVTTPEKWPIRSGS